MKKTMKKIVATIFFDSGNGYDCRNASVCRRIRGK